MIFKDNSIYELIDKTSKNPDGPSTGVFCIMTYLHGITLISKACTLSLENNSETENKIYKNIKLRCQNEIKDKLPLAKKDNQYFNDFISSSDEEKIIKRKDIDIVPETIIDSGEDILRFMRPYRNLFSEPYLCEIDCGIDLIQTSSDMAKRIIETNKGILCE